MVNTTYCYDAFKTSLVSPTTFPDTTCQTEVIMTNRRPSVEAMVDSFDLKKAYIIFHKEIQRLEASSIIFFLLYAGNVHKLLSI